MAHNNTVFSQLLKLISRHEFETLAIQHHSGRSFRTASRWSQFVTLSLAQLTGRNSLRDIVENMSAQAHRLYHLGSATLSRHVGLNHNGYLPEFVTITDVKNADITVGRTLSFPKGRVVAIDKGYNDYSWYNQLTGRGIFFVTRLKSNVSHRGAHRHAVLKNKGLICDQTIEFTGARTLKKCPIQLRRIGYKDVVTGNAIPF